VRLVLDDEQGDVERVLEVDGGELSSRGLDEREVASLDRLLEPAVVASLDRHEHKFAPGPADASPGVGDAKPGTSDTVATALCCKNCGTRWFAPAPERLL
jgi:hypothetical protein